VFAIFTVRRGNSEDVKIAGELWLNFAREQWTYQSDICPHDENRRRWEIFARIQADAGLLLIAEEEGKIVGFALLGMGLFPLEQEVPSGFLHDLYVEPSKRGHGVGKLLLAKGMEELRRLGCRRVRLSVLAENKQALSFYHRAGFKTQALGLYKDI